MGSRGQALSSIRLLLDEHIDPRVSQALRRNGIDAIVLRDYGDGSLLGSPDEETLAAATSDLRALVTFDLRTIPPLLRRLAEIGTPHGGVVLVSVRTVIPNDVRRLTRLLCRLAERFPEGLDGQVFFLGA